VNPAGFVTALPLQAIITYRGAELDEAEAALAGMA
jgi:hypothetical protein